MRPLTIVIPTFNRAATLARSLRAALAERPASADLQIVVVDNNSTDGTAAAVRAFDDPRLRYVRETRQGLSHARNAGIAAALERGVDPAAHIIAFTDDDVEVERGWADTVVRAFDQHPDADAVGGRVLPRWPSMPPRWLTRDHWAPLALQDHGPEGRVFDQRDPRGLVGANMAFRAAVFDRDGLFSTSVQRVRDGIGSTEDHELLRRLYEAGGRARYVPDLIVVADVQQDRLTRAYHRRWHRGHGRFHAMMRLPEVEQSRGRLLGVPLHLFRSALADLAAWVRLRLTGDAARAFAAETRLWFFGGFLMERCACVPRR